MPAAVLVLDDSACGQVSSDAIPYATSYNIIENYAAFADDRLQSCAFLAGG